MNSRKICIILCASDQNQINASIDKLNIPDGYELEKRYIVGESNIAKAYNQIIDITDAKYKIYLQSAVSINNKNILEDILKIFLKDNKIGAIGMVGADTIPTSGIWEQSIHKYGKYYEGLKSNKSIVKYQNIEMEYKKVKVVDSMFIATQHDIRWREDLFNDMYFYGTAQCIEFARAGYEIVVPKQDKPWCIKSSINSILKEKYTYYNEIFLDEYSKDIFPIVSILIAAYNRPELFKIALESAINQTYKNIEIIVCDDSTNDGVRNVIEPYLEKYQNIKYYNNGGPLGNYGVNNVLKCLELSSGELVNYLMDDDVFHKEKIKKMANYCIEYQNVSLVTSYRKVIDIDGNELEDIEPTKMLINDTSIIGGRKLSEVILLKMANILGEPTTVLFRKKNILSNGFGKYSSKQYTTIIDVATWISLLQNGDAVYIAESLSYFRIHDGQNENKPELILKGIIEWFSLINDYCENNKLSKYNQIITNWVNLVVNCLEVIRKTDEFKDLDLKELYNCYNHAIKKILNI